MVVDYNLDLPVGVEETTDSYLTVEGINDYEGKKIRAFTLKAKEVTVSFRTNEEYLDSVSEMPEDITVFFGDTIVLSGEPVREGYIFFGWELTQENADAAKTYIPNGTEVPVYEDMTFYPVWVSESISDAEITELSQQYYTSEEIEEMIAEAAKDELIMPALTDKKEEGGFTVVD